MHNCIAIGISLPKEIMKKIDTDRGDVPRSRYLLRMREKQYPFEGKNVVEKGLLDREFETLGSSKPMIP
jgi:hypothetical protein